MQHRCVALWATEISKSWPKEPGLKEIKTLPWLCPGSSHRLTHRYYLYLSVLSLQGMVHFTEPWHFLSAPSSRPPTYFLLRLNKVLLKAFNDRLTEEQICKSLSEQPLLQLTAALTHTTYSCHIQINNIKYWIMFQNL